MRVKCLISAKIFDEENRLAKVEVQRVLAQNKKTVRKNSGSNPY